VLRRWYMEQLPVAWLHNSCTLPSEAPSEYDHWYLYWIQRYDFQSDKGKN